MNDEDLPMEDEGDRVIASTEINDGPADDAAEYVDPMDVFTNPNTSHLPKNAQIPPSESPLFPRSASHYVDSRSDKMDITQTALHRRASPQVQIPPRPRTLALPIATLKTGLVYDPRMRFHAELPSETSVEDIHPETHVASTRSSKRSEKLDSYAVRRILTTTNMTNFVGELVFGQLRSMRFY